MAFAAPAIRTVPAAVFGSAASVRHPIGRGDGGDIGVLALPAP
jgi:hypothetical protein